ncbi:hypothetical protein [Streptomyces sp. NPDC008150]|uniref:hypothetical protein n=1 Tax=Streptomyces sp. NPDC008150 TaxID=3364816 RepID=UPI0036EC116B
MPVLAKAEEGAIEGLIPAGPGLRVTASVAQGADTSQIPVPGRVVAWAQVIAAAVPGGARIEPVFLADGRTWTPDQFLAAYGAGIRLSVAQG